MSLKSGMKRCTGGEVRRARGREFQIVGAAKWKDRRAWEDLKKGTVIMRLERLKKNNIPFQRSVEDAIRTSTRTGKNVNQRWISFKEV